MKKRVMALLVLLFFLFLGVEANGVDTIRYERNNQEENLSEDVIGQAMLAYQEFLEGRITVDGIDIDNITVPTGEPDRHYETKYAFFDCDRNGVPELHVNSARYYYIFQYKDETVQVYKNLSPYPHYFTLQNGAFISHRMGAGNKSDEYQYYIFDTFGREIFHIGFSKYDENGNGEYDEDDEYIFDNVKVTKEIWEDLTRQYLYEDEDGIEQIKNEIEWLKMEF